MTAITCVKCGKTYDFDKTYGICPKCSRFNNIRSSQQLHAQMHEEQDRGTTHRQLHGKYDDVTQAGFHYNEELMHRRASAEGNQKGSYHADNTMRKSGSFAKTMLLFIAGIVIFFTVMTFAMIFMLSL